MSHFTDQSRKGTGSGAGLTAPREHTQRELGDSSKSVCATLRGLCVPWSFKKDGRKPRKGYGSNEAMERK